MRVLVTGAASGIGRATCLRLAALGRESGSAAAIAAVDIAPSAALDALYTELTERGATCLPLIGDLGNAEVPAQLVEQACNEFGGLDGLVSNAGVNCPGRLVDYAVEDWDRLFAVNTRATWLLGKAAHRALKDSGGAVVTVASMSGSNAHANLGAYAPSKAAAIMLMRVMAQEFGADGIRVNSVSPGMVRTGMTTRVYENNEVAQGRADLVPLGRIAEPEDIAEAIAYLLSPQSRYINGHDLVVDGGLTGNFLGRLPGLTAITKG
jgi:NAD(P)-dependent dehydrogenase (short-subunit alcohol dehydrogenase family)